LALETKTGEPICRTCGIAMETAVRAVYVNMTNSLTRLSTTIWE